MIRLKPGDTGQINYLTDLKTLRKRGKAFLLGSITNLKKNKN
jgi:hypothetical protein